jgi:hypothetical protein
MSSSDLAPMWTPPLNESAESEIKVPLWGRGIDSRNRVWNWVANLHRLAGRYDNPIPMYLVPSPHSGTFYRLWTQWYLYWTVYLCQIYVHVSKPEGSTFFCGINYYTSSSAVKLVAGFISMLVVACRRLWDTEIYELWDTHSKRDHNALYVRTKKREIPRNELVQYNLKRGQDSTAQVLFSSLF